MGLRGHYSAPDPWLVIAVAAGPLAVVPYVAVANVAGHVIIPYAPVALAFVQVGFCCGSSRFH